MKSFKSIGRGIFLSLFLATGLGVPQSVLAETAVWDGSMIRPSQGLGTPEDPYLITCAEEFAYLIQNYDYSNSGVYYKKHYKLTKDLDLKSTQWTFGSATNERKTFRAHFDGAGHKISNIEIALSDNPKECHYGLFPQLGGDKDFESVIENLEVENIHFIRSTGDANGTYNWRIGGLVGQMYSHSRISNCIVHGFSVTDYATDVNMRPTSRISSCPLIGEIQHKFGDTGSFHKERGIMIESCYGHGTSDLSHFHGNEGQVFSTDVQGKKQMDGYSYNGYVWYALGEDENSFSMSLVDVTPAMGGNKFQYEGFFDRVRGHTYTYRWMLDGKRVGTNTSAIVTVEPKPYVQRLSLTLYDNGQESGSGAILIEPDKYNLEIDTITPGSKKVMHNVTVRMSTESGLDIGEHDFDFVWQDMTDNYKQVGDQPTLVNARDGHTYLCIATHREHAAAKFTIVQSFCKPIYVCNRGISEFEASLYTLDNQQYNVGNDLNDGLTPETPVKTLKKAYELLDPMGNIGSNVIVIMGEYADHDFTEFLDNRCTRRNPSYFVKDRPALITGRMGNFRNSRMLFAGLSIKFNADTRFEQINLHGTSFEINELTDQAKVFACGNNLTMGYGISINGYKVMDYTQGMTEGVFVPSITIYGGQLNNNDPEYVSKDNVITIYSGTYGRVIAGDGYTLQMEKTGNVSGQPQRPIRTRIVCDAANYFDPYHSQYDVSLIIGGQGDGCIFADTQIEVKGASRVGRIVGGNVAFGRTIPGKPTDSFFGQTDITVSGGTVNEIIGTNLGRYGHILYPDETDHDSCVTYFYGRSNINLIGGTIVNHLTGGGSADIVGYDYDSKHHTYDNRVPFWRDGQVEYGQYEEAKGKMPIVQLRDGILDLSKTELHINIGGDANIRCSVYGGSESVSSLLPTRQAASQVGCIYGDTYINMTGGLVEGYLFGGCHGDLTYFENSDNSAFPTVNGQMVDRMYFSRIGQMYGNTHISVTGGEVLGLIYGGGEGTYYRAMSETDLTNAVDLIGATYGTTQVNIGGDATLHEYIFGAGNYAHILRTGDEAQPELAGCTEVNISGGNMYGAVFGAGHGNKDEINDLSSIYPKVEGDVRVNLTGGQFLYNELAPRYISRRVYGVCCAGMATSTVKGDTYLNIEVNPFPEDLKNNPKISADQDLLLCAGGYDKDCAVAGTTHLTLNAPKNVLFEKLHGGSVFGTVGSTQVSILSGKIKSLYGGSRYGDVFNSTNIVVGVENDSINANDNIEIESVYGGNEAGGTVGGKKDTSGAHVKINGGSIMNVFGAGDGGLQSYNSEDPASFTKPYTSATWISVSGTDSAVAVIQNLYGGGNNATVGFFDPAPNHRPEFGMSRVDLRPNSGNIHINIGSHVRIGNLVMGSNGEHLLDYIPSYTLDGKTWHKGFESQADFETFCHSVDVSCVPVLTFNKDGLFHNDYAIDDRLNRKVVFETPGEMDADDIIIDNFFGGGNRGSMTGDSLYQYTLPTGVLIRNSVVGGCQSSIIEYTESEGPHKGTVRRWVGGMRPYRNVESAIHEQRTQLNLFCQFSPLQAGTDSIGRSCHIGAKVYGGCQDRGVSVGVSVVNLHSDLIGDYQKDNLPSLFNIAREWTGDAAQIYGGGKGAEAEAVGNTYVNLKGAVFNGKKCIPNVMHAFGGGMAGNVVGRSNIYCDFQCPIADPMDAITHCVWGSLYGGGRQGSIVRHSQLIPEVEEPKDNGTHVRVWSGQIDRVYGGSRIGNVEGASFVDIDDRAEHHFHTIIRQVFGGNDLSGKIGMGTIPPMVEGNDSIHTSTYVLIREQRKQDGQYTGFPLIAEVFGGGNGEYGDHNELQTVYQGGSIPTRNGGTINLAGLEYPNVDSTYVEVRGGAIWYLYGGANNSYVTQGTTLHIDYGDDNAHERCSFNASASRSCYERGKHAYNHMQADGGAIVNDSIVRAMYNILSVFGGNKTAPMVIQPNWHLGQAKIHNVYGGCNKGNVYYYADNNQQGNTPHMGLRLDLECPKLNIDNVYGGCRMASVLACHSHLDPHTHIYHHKLIDLKDYEYGTTIHVGDGTYGRIFGGNDISGSVLSGTRIQVEGGKIGEVYGAGNGEYVYQVKDDVKEVQAVFDKDLQQYICQIPRRNGVTTDFDKIKLIEKIRPNIAKSCIEIAGGLDAQSGQRKTVYISGAVYAGGNCATVLDNNGKPGDIQIDLGDYIVINNVYLGSNGQHHIDKEYIQHLMAYNDFKSMAEEENGRNLLDYHMDAVTMHGLPRDFQLRRRYDKCYIGSFYMGGARGSLAAHGELSITFPQTMTIFNKIVGGSDQARIIYSDLNGSVSSEGGLLWDGIGSKPEIALEVECPFRGLEMKMDDRFKITDYLCKYGEDDNVQVYPGCYLNGKVEGAVNVNINNE